MYDVSHPSLRYMFVSLCSIYTATTTPHSCIGVSTHQYSACFMAASFNHRWPPKISLGNRVRVGDSLVRIFSPPFDFGRVQIVSIVIIWRALHADSCVKSSKICLSFICVRIWYTFPAPVDNNSSSRSSRVRLQQPILTYLLAEIAHAL